MAQVTGNQLFLPFERERKNDGAPRNPKQVQQRCNALITEVFRKNAERGKSNPFIVCAINRVKPSIHRWFNLAMTISDEVRPSALSIVEYAGAMGHAEALLEGDWYIASPEEEAVCAARDAADTEAAKQRINQEKMGAMKEVFSGMAQAVLSMSKEAPASAAETPKLAAVVAAVDKSKHKTAV